MELRAAICKRNQKKILSRSKQSKKGDCAGTIKVELYRNSVKLMNTLLLFSIDRDNGKPIWEGRADMATVTGRSALHLREGK